MRRIAVLMACLLAGPAAAAPSPATTAICRVTQIDESGAHPYAIWKGTPDGQPREYTWYRDGQETRATFARPLGGSDRVVRVYVTSPSDGKTRYWYLQQLDADGHVTREERIGALTTTWTYEDGVLVGNKYGTDPPLGWHWSYDDAGHLVSVEPNMFAGYDPSYYWTWDEEGRLVGELWSAESSYRTTFDAWDALGLPTHAVTLHQPFEGNDYETESTWTWDERGRLTSAHDGRDLTYTWTDGDDGSNASTSPTARRTRGIPTDVSISIGLAPKTR